MITTDFIRQFLDYYLSVTLARVVAVMLVALIIWRIWRGSARIGALVLGVVCVGCTAFTVIKSFSPAGTYVLIEFEAPEESQDHFWRLSDGSAQQIVGNESFHYGSYRKTKDGWIMVSHETSKEGPLTWKMRFSVFGFQLCKEGGCTLFFARRIVPFVRPSWMPDWLQ